MNLEESQIAEFFTGKVMILTGAGVSVASGLPTFRGDGGLYDGMNPYELATPEAFEEHPATVWNWYLKRIHTGKDAVPNPAHLAIAELEQIAERVTVLTTNVDPLHHRAGSSRIFRIHGDILQARCLECSKITRLDPHRLPLTVTDETLFECDCGGRLRPNIVWFGERPWPGAFQTFRNELPDTDIFLEVGTSGMVSYGLTQMAAQHVPTVRINPDGDPEPRIQHIREPAEVAVPRLVDLARQLPRRV